MSNQIQFTVKGDVPCIKNGMLRGKYGGLYYKPEISQYFNDFSKQVKKADKQCLSGELSLKVFIIRKDKLKDCMNIMDTICDALQKSGVIKNDRDIVECQYFGRIINKKDPQIMITLEVIKDE